MVQMVPFSSHVSLRRSQHLVIGLTSENLSPAIAYTVVAGASNYCLPGIPSSTSELSGGVSSAPSSTLKRTTLSSDNQTADLTPSTVLSASKISSSLRVLTALCGLLFVFAIVSLGCIFYLLRKTASSQHQAQALSAQFLEILRRDRRLSRSEDPQPSASSSVQYELPPRRSRPAHSSWGEFDAGA